jgi:uncharacterized membrane protein
MVVEMMGRKNTVFMVTVPGPAVSPTLEHLRKSGIGVSVGRVILTTIDYLKPELAKPLSRVPEEKKDDEEGAETKDGDENDGRKKRSKAPPLKGFQHFQKARRTTEELYNEISNGANMNMNTWMNLIGAALMSAGGLATNTTVFIVGGMLVSPIMGPILGMTFGYRIADWPLFRAGFINEFKMALAAFFIGLLYGFVLGDTGNTYNWPTTAMSPSESQGYNMVISIIVSAAAGLVLGVSLTSTGGNALVGTAISAGLLPPIVNAGMMIAYSIAYAPKNKKDQYYEMGNYAILFYASHVVTIVVVANIVFWLKDIDPRFRDGEDASFDDIPSLVEHKKRLQAKGAEGNITNLEKEKAAYFVQNIRDDLEDTLYEFRDRMLGVGNFVKGGLDKVTGGLITKADKALGTHRDPAQAAADRKRSGSEVDQKKKRMTSVNQEEEEDDDVEQGLRAAEARFRTTSTSASEGVSSTPLPYPQYSGPDVPSPVVMYADPETNAPTAHDNDEYISTAHNPLLTNRR